MIHQEYLTRLKQFGFWRCDLGRTRGKGTVACAGGPYHSCRFEFLPKIRVRTHKLEHKPVIRPFW